MALIRLLLILSIFFFESSGAISNEWIGKKQSPLTILGLGDSITEGGEDFFSYLYPLWEELYSKGYLIDFIGPKQQKCRIGKLSHAGYSGKTAEFLETKIDSIYREYPADIVLIHSGHNHFAEENPVAGLIETYKSIIKKIKNINPEVTIMIAQVINSGKLPKYSYIPQLNGEIASMVKDLNDPKIILVDQCSRFDWKKHTIEDRVHPNRQGARLMADVWFDALTKILPAPLQSIRPAIYPYKTIGTDSLKVHVFKPRKVEKDSLRAAIVYFFAGGFKLGTPLQFYRECDYYASKGLIAVTVDYRIGYLYNNSIEDSLLDAQDAICWLRNNAKTLGLDPDRIIVSGASAGGYLAVSLGINNINSCYQPNLLVLNYPVLEHLKIQGSHTPPILFIVGSNDPLVPLAAVDNFEEKIKYNGSEFELHIIEGKGHPLFEYRKSPDDTFYRIREITDNFLIQHGYLKN